MNWFLLFVILLMCGGGFYEYQNLHGQAVVDEMQISSLQAKLQDAISAGQKSTSDLVQLKTTLADARAKVDDLTRQLQAAKAAAAQAAAQAAPQNSAPTAGGPATAASPTAPSVPTTKLGTINAIDGKVYPNCQLLRINADNIVVSDSDGIMQIEMSVLPPAMQKQFGFDPKQGVLSNDVLATLEQQRQADAASGR